jgi:hypothetical protein
MTTQPVNHCQLGTIVGAIKTGKRQKSINQRQKADASHNKNNATAVMMTHNKRSIDLEDDDAVDGGCLNSVNPQR